MAFIDIYNITDLRVQENSVKSLMEGKGVPIHVGEERRFEIVFTTNAFTSNEAVNVFVNTTLCPSPVGTPDYTAKIIIP